MPVASRCNCQHRFLQATQAKSNCVVCESMKSASSQNLWPGPDISIGCQSSQQADQPLRTHAGAWYPFRLHKSWNVHAAIMHAIRPMLLVTQTQCQAPTAAPVAHSSGRTGMQCRTCIRSTCHCIKKASISVLQRI